MNTGDRVVGGREPDEEMSIIAKGLACLPFVLGGEFMGIATELKQAMHGAMNK